MYLELIPDSRRSPASSVVVNDANGYEWVQAGTSLAAPDPQPLFVRSTDVEGNRKVGGAVGGREWPIMLLVTGSSASDLQEKLDALAVVVDALNRHGGVARVRPTNLANHTDAPIVHATLGATQMWSKMHDAFNRAFVQVSLVVQPYSLYPSRDLLGYDFADDTALDEWEARDGFTAKGDFEVDAGGPHGVLSPSATANVSAYRELVYTDNGHVYEDGAVQAKFRVGAVAATYWAGLVWRSTDGATFIRGSIYIAASGTTYLYLEYDAGSGTVSNSTVTVSRGVGDAFWLRLRRERGGFLSVDYFSQEDEPTPNETPNATRNVRLARGSRDGLSSEMLPAMFWAPEADDAEMMHFRVLGHAYHDFENPGVVPIGEGVPGNAGALANVTLAPDIAEWATPPIWALLSWWPEPGAPNVCHNGHFLYGTEGWSASDQNSRLNGGATLAVGADTERVYDQKSLRITTDGALANEGASFRLPVEFQQGELWVGAAWLRAYQGANADGNLMNANAASMEVDASEWAAVANCTVAHSSLASAHGDDSLLVESTAAAIQEFRPTDLLPVTEGQQYTARIEVNARDVAREVRVAIRWFDGAGTFIGGSASAQVTTAVGSWTEVAHTATIPSGVGATQGRMYVFVDNAAAAGEGHYIDKAGFFAGAASTWDEVAHVDMVLGGAGDVDVTSVTLRPSDGWVRTEVVHIPVEDPLPDMIVRVSDVGVSKINAAGIVVREGNDDTTRMIGGFGYGVIPAIGRDTRNSGTYFADHNGTTGRFDDYVRGGGATANDAHLAYPIITDALLADENADGEVLVSLWGRMLMDDTAEGVTEVTVTPWIESEAGGDYGKAYSFEYGSDGKSVVLPASGFPWRLHFLGTLAVRIDRDRPLRLRLMVDTDITGSGMTTGTEFGWDYFVLLPARQMRHSQTGVAGAAYDEFIPTVASEVSKKVYHNGAAEISDPSNEITKRPLPDVGLGGTPMVLPPGQRMRVLSLLSSIQADYPLADGQGMEADDFYTQIELVPRSVMARKDLYA